MEKAKLKKGQKLVCVPCGREVTINNCGIARTTVWCCEKPMKAKVRKALKKSKAKR
jgi:hypothetical protein